MTTDNSCQTDKTTCKCAWPWLSGFFAVPAFVHLVHVLAGWRVVIGDYEISTKMSAVCIALFGTLAIVCGLLGCRDKKSA